MLQSIHGKVVVLQQSIRRSPSFVPGSCKALDDSLPIWSRGSATDNDEREWVESLLASGRLSADLEAQARAWLLSGGPTLLPVCFA